MRGRTLQNRVDQVVVQVDVEARLLEGIERSTRRAAGNEPGLQIRQGRVTEVAALSYVVSMATNQVGTGVAIRL